MYIDKLIKREVITLLVSVSLLVIIFIGVTYAKFLSVDKGQDTVVNMGDLNISFCKDTTCDSTYTNIGQVIGTKVENGATVPAGIYPFKADGSYSNETPYIFKVENTGSLDSTVKIKLKEDTSFTPSGDYSDYARLTSKYASHLKVTIRKRILYKDTNYQLGDVNMDGFVNNKDVDVVKDYHLNKIELNETQKILADVNYDKLIDAYDITRLKSSIIGKAALNDGTITNLYSYTDLEDGIIFKDDIIKSGESAIYFLWLYLDDTTPNDAQKTYYVGNIDVEGEYIPSNEVYCYYGGELKQGAEYVNGNYTYKYKQEGDAWANIEEDGWGVVLTNKKKASIIDSDVCTYIDGKPIVSMASMYSESESSKIDLSKLNTSNVVNMKSMFEGSMFTNIDVSNFDTSKVRDMSNMFFESEATSINIDNFDTSNVTNMEAMFALSKVKKLDLSSFDTSKVTEMGFMFDSSEVKTIYVKKFDITAANDSINSEASMFYGCSNLVGGSGTRYSESNANDGTYAHIDGGTSNPGYFTDVSSKNIPEPNSFSTDSWATIIRAVREDNISKYNVGDTKNISMSNYNTHTLRLVNKSTPSECLNDGFSQSTCGFVIEFEDVITTYYMNPAGTYKGTKYSYGWNVDGWPVTSMRNLINDNIYNSLPDDLKSGIMDTTVVSGHGNTSGEENFTSTDKLYLFSTAEIWAKGSSNLIENDTAADVTRQLDYYKLKGVTTKNYDSAIKSNVFWWLRTAHSNYNDVFYGVSVDGSWKTDAANGIGGISPAFRIG